MNIIKTPIEGVYVINSDLFCDQRGSFSRLFCEQELLLVLGKRKIVQINFSSTNKQGIIRGIHFQYPPAAEMKFIRCLKGKVFDVAVDLRRHSKTFLQWHSVNLEPSMNNMLVVPEGCGHGFQTLKTDCELLYLHTSSYNPEQESGILFDEPMVNIKWPIKIKELSERDRNHPVIDNGFSGIVL